MKNAKYDIAYIDLEGTDLTSSPVIDYEKFSRAFLICNMVVITNFLIAGVKQPSVPVELEKDADENIIFSLTNYKVTVGAEETTVTAINDVIKEVYLTIDSNDFQDENFISIDDYKTKYGVDLRTIFEWEKNGDYPAISSPVKLFGLIKGSSNYNNFVFPATIEPQANVVTIFMMIPSANTEESYTKNADQGLVVNFLTGEITFYEI